jgi:U3 small nucleolar RNA-associated protein 18
VIQSVRFHPNAPVILTAGLDKTLRLFHINGKENQKLKSYFIKDIPILNASFTPDGSEIVITGRRNYFYTLDLKKEKVRRVTGITGIFSITRSRRKQL